MSPPSVPSAIRFGLLLAAGLACSSSSTVETPSPNAALRLLFVGNSLTYGHDVPGLVRQLAVSAGRPEPDIVSRALANYGLEDHWTDGWVQATLADEHFDIMLMQQGPSTLSSSGVDLTHWVTLFAAEARKHGTRPAVYATWAPVGSIFLNGVANYRAAADATGSAHYPASLAWHEAWQMDPELPLYESDQFHASEHGAMLAAMVIAGIVFDIAPSTMPNLFVSIVSPAQHEALRQSATAAIRATGRR